MEEEMADVEVEMEDLAITVEEPEIIQGPTMVVGISKEVKEAFSRTLSSFMITRDSTT